MGTIALHFYLAKLHRTFQKTGVSALPASIVENSEREGYQSRRQIATM